MVIKTYSCTQDRDLCCFCPYENIRTHHKCEGAIDKSIPRITDWHHEACRMMPNGDREGQISLSPPHTNNEFFFLLTTKYLILYY